MSIEIDTSEVRELIADWTRVPDMMAREGRPAIERGARNIRDQLRDEMRSSTHFKGAAKSISYDLDDDGYGAEIGPKKGGPGAIAVIAYFGGSAWSGRRRPGRGWQQGPGGGGTVPDPLGALEAEAPRFEKALADKAAELLR